MANDNMQQPVVPKPSAKEAEQVGLRVSLIPAQEEKIKNPRVGFARFVTAIIIAGVAIFSFVAYLFVRVELAKKEIIKINTATEATEQLSLSLKPALKEAKFTKIRLAALSDLLAKHRNVGNIFDFFEAHTLKDVAFSSIAVGENRIVNLAASAGSFEAYAGQINEFRAQPLVESVASSGLNPIYNTNNELAQVDFTLSITFSQSIFIDQTDKK